MINYQYQIIRYMHDQFTGEFANLGIVLYSPQANFLQCRLTSRYARVSEFFGEVNGQFLMAALKQFEASIKRLSEDEQRLFASTNKTENLDAITSTILPKDDSALQLTDVIHGLDMAPEAALHDLYDRIIERYNADEGPHRHTDQQAWSRVYKKYFEEYGVSRQLKKHVVSTEKDAIPFDKAWKNGVWNCFQPLALNLVTEEAIRSKVYKWSGIIRELETVKEEFRLYFLTTTPKEHKTLQSFIDEKLTYKDEKLMVSIVREEEAETFAANVRKEMEKSRVIEDNEMSF